ncbi:hypothetical protein MRB53_022671 [Persea americana]|uniref:Uncharacterized protein n=1 Tax=Persea americana TaxID=3435 RepID=A0ACC2L7T8_PERAE|nr:hypothetical protein MRB53_022671 [Persea americana]
MAASSSSSLFFGVREEDQNQMIQQQSSTTTSIATTTATQKKKRNLPGKPNPDAEVIALSPKSLMATNRFICEVCNKGFQREQNLQLHRRGHNLPWKLKQKTTKEVRRKVYLCPEPTCVHHDPSRALGDLTGIKKHFSRKHGEKKWKCEKCSKRYAVQSDWKAHSKTCGTREYRCDCGTLFSRRDSFITHRAFCDALAQESARLPSVLNTMGSHLHGNNNMALSLPQLGSQFSSMQDQNHPSTNLLRLGSAGGAQFDQLISPSNQSSFHPPQSTPSSPFFLHSSNQNFNEPQPHQSLLQSKPFHGLMQLPDLQGNNTNNSSSVNLLNLSFFNSATTSSINSNYSNSNPRPSGLLIPDQLSNMMNTQMGSGTSSLYNPSFQNDSVLPQMSATALLQKAAQMGATTSSTNISLLRGFSSSSANTAKDDRSQHMQPNFQGSFGSGGDESLRSQVENETHLQNLIMNSLPNGFGSLDRNLCNMGGSDGLTRDFLGVGGMVRGISRTISQREQHLGIGSLGSGMNAADVNRCLGGGNLQ